MDKLKPEYMFLRSRGGSALPPEEESDDDDSDDAEAREAWLQWKEERQKVEVSSYSIIDCVGSH